MTTPNIWGNMVRGVAIGDAWGYPNEFRGIDSLTRDNPMGPNIPQRLIVTDDTQMTLFLASALDESWGKDMATVKAAIREAFLEYRDDPDNNRAPGATVMGSLRRLSNLPWTEATSHGSDGSGTVMRTSPCAFLPEDRWVGITAYAAAITHGTANAVAAALLNTKVLRDIIAGTVKAEDRNLVEHAYQLAQDPGPSGMLNTGEWLEDLPINLDAGFKELKRLLGIARDNLAQLRANPWDTKSDPSLYIGGGGWRAHETLVIALLAIDMMPVDAPEDALRRSVTTDGDSDTIGAVAGGLIGALYPEEFLTAWGDDEMGDNLRSHFEQRYVAWIENEADHYRWVDA